MPPKRKVHRKPKPKPTGIEISRARKVAKRINSMETTASFASQIAQEYEQGNLDKRVLTLLRLEIRLSRLSKPEKNRRRRIIKGYQERKYL